MEWTFRKYEREKKPVFSILIPTWNNLSFVQLCVESIRKNSQLDHQIILHINDGSDGTLAWAREAGLDHSWSDRNAGICLAVNAAASLADADIICYFNDDMYALPDWDRHLMDAVADAPADSWFLSSTMIEPTDTGNACVIAPADFGRNPDNFREAELLKQFASMEKKDWSGATWPPNIVPRKLWELVGGYSIEFSPGMSSDPDFSMKLWQCGVRYFKGVGNSRVYHFQGKSTQKIFKNPGNKQFLKKWGITQSAFHKHYLKRGEAFAGILKEPEKSAGYEKDILKSKIKSFFIR